MARFRRVQIEPEGAQWLFWEAPCAARGKGGQFPPIMSVATMRKQPTGPVKQFSVFTPNRLGRLHTLTTLLASRNVHILALTVLDTTDSAIIRLVVDDPEAARALLNEHGFPFSESELLVVEIAAETQLKDVLAALLQAEINIHYIYSFMTRSQDKTALALNLEDREVAEDALQKQQFKVLGQADISR